VDFSAFQHPRIAQYLMPVDNEAQARGGVAEPSMLLVADFSTATKKLKSVAAESFAVMEKCADRLLRLSGRKVKSASF
jgi:hypothetical protein